MKRFLSRYKLILAASAFLLAGCGTPQVMLFNVEVLQPKAFTLTVDDQDVAVVATYTQADKDSSSSALLALGAARFIETGNALEEGSIGAYTIPEEEYSGTRDKEYLEQLMMATGSGTLVMLSKIELGETAVSRVIDPITRLSVVGSRPVKAMMEVYDAISDTTLFASEIKDSLLFRIPLEQDLTQQGIASFLKENDSLIIASLGAMIAQRISQEWMEEEWMLIDYPQEDRWHTAYKHAMDFKWEDAIKEWIPLTEDKDSEKASFAAFNIAVACQMIGNTDLAESWIGYARSRYDFEEARQLQKYLKLKKTTSN